MKTLIFLIFLLLILVLASCGKKPNYVNTVTNHQISAGEISNIMSNAGINSVNLSSFILDTSYSLPSENWIRNEFSLVLQSYLKSFKSSEWVSEENDCDNFSVISYAFAQLLHHNTPQKINKTALTFGELWYVKDSFDGHAINVVIVWENENKYKVIFYEPQIQQIINLSKTELDSIMFYRF